MGTIHDLTQCFIGKNIKVIKSPCQSLIGLQGKIVDETKFTFKVDTKNERKQLNKKQIVFVTGNNKTIINGKDIMKKPSERLKLRIKK